MVNDEAINRELTICDKETLGAMPSLERYKMVFECCVHWNEIGCVLTPTLGYMLTPTLFQPHFYKRWHVFKYSKQQHQIPTGGCAQQQGTCENKGFKRHHKWLSVRQLQRPTSNIEVNFLVLVVTTSAYSFYQQEEDWRNTLANCWIGI